VRRGRFAGVDLPFAQKNLRFFSKDFNRRIFGCAFLIAATPVAAPRFCFVGDGEICVAQAVEAITPPFR
jgi:hypothetical protein